MFYLFLLKLTELKLTVIETNQISVNRTVTEPSVVSLTAPHPYLEPLLGIGSCCICLSILELQDSVFLLFTD